MRVRVVAALLAVGLLAGCGTEEKKTAIQLLSGASDSAMKQKSANIDIDMKMSGAAFEASGRDSVSIKMAGPMALDGSVAKITMDLNSFIPGAGNGDISMLIVDGTIYMDFKALMSAVSKGSDEELPAKLRNVRWLTQKLPKGEPGSASPSSYTQYLDYLRGASQDGVTELDSETIDGVATRHFKATIKPSAIREEVDKITAKYPKALREQLETGLKTLDGGPIAMEAWVAKDGTPRRIGMTMQMDVPDAGKIKMEMTMNFSDFGVDIADIKAPAAGVTMPFDEFQEFASS